MDSRHALSLTILTLFTASAHALQPLEEFVTAARVKAPDNQEAKASREVLDADNDVAWGRVLPGVTAQGTYTRNQYESIVTLPGMGGQPDINVTITPSDQWNGFIALNVPLINLANFWQIKAARLSREAGDLNIEATQLAVEAQV